MLSVNVMIYFSLFVLCTKKSFQVSITSDQVDKFLRQFIEKGLMIYGLYVTLYLCRLMLKVRQNVDVISVRQFWLRT